MPLTIKTGAVKVKDESTGNYVDIDMSLGVDYAPINSPDFAGTPTAPTPTSSDNSTKIATTAFVQGKVNDALKPVATRATVTAPTLTDLWLGTANDGVYQITGGSLSGTFIDGADNAYGALTIGRSNTYGYIFYHTEKSLYRRRFNRGGTTITWLSTLERIPKVYYSVTEMGLATSPKPTLMQIESAMADGTMAVIDNSQFDESGLTLNLGLVNATLVCKINDNRVFALGARSYVNVNLPNSRLFYATYNNSSKLWYGWKEVLLKETSHVYPAWTTVLLFRTDNSNMSISFPAPLLATGNSYTCTDAVYETHDTKGTDVVTSTLTNPTIRRDGDNISLIYPIPTGIQKNRLGLCIARSAVTITAT